MTKKKLLIIKPPYTTFAMGLAYVLSCLDKHGIPFDFVDTTLPFLDYKKNLKREDYLAVASGGLIGHFRFFSEIVKNVHKANRALPIIIGGNITKDIKHEFLIDNIGVDFGVVGEAETSLPYLVHAIAKGRDEFDDIPGVIYRNRFTSKLVSNMPARLDLGTDNIMPAWKYFDLNYYISNARIPYCGRHSFMPVLTGRGCVGQCSFCSPTIGFFRMRPIKHVMEEIELLNRNYDFEWIVIGNEMSYQTKEQMLSFCEAYNKLKIRKPWYSSLRTDVNFDKETFMAMKDAGCVGLSVGIESGSDRILKLMRKGTTVDQTKRFFRIANEIGLSCSGNFMVGNEGETEKEIRESVDMVIDEEMTSDASLTSSYPGTLIYKNALKRGLITDEWEYLQKFKFACNVWDWGWTDRSYTNITEIPNEKFWDIIVNELRYFYTSLFDRYQAKDTRFILLLNTLCLKAKGLCPHCGEATAAYPPFTLLEMEAYCPKCFHRVYFDIYKYKKFGRHFDFLRRELQCANTIVIAGTGPETSAFLRIDRFGTDYGKIRGFLDLDPQQSWSDMFINKPRLKLEDLIGIAPDMILAVDDKVSHSELIIKKFYSGKGRKAPKILSLFPASKIWSFILMSLIEKNNKTMSFGIRLTKLLIIAEKVIIKTAIILVDMAQTKPKRVIFKKIIYEFRYLWFLLSGLWKKDDNKEIRSIKHALLNYIHRYKTI